MFSMHRRATTLAAVLLASAGVLGWLAAGTAPSSHSASGPSITMYGDGAKVQGAEGGLFTMPIFINDAVDVGGFEFEVHFDDAIISIDQVTEGSFLGQGGSTVCVPSSAPGVMSYGCVLIGGTGVSGSGGLAELRFVFDQDFDGSLVLDMQNCQLADSDGDAIAVKGCQDATLNVIPEPPAAPMNMQPASMKAQAPPGSTFTFDVTVGDVTDLGGLEFAVEFDESILNVSNIREGPFFGSEGGDTVCFFDNYSAGDRARIGCVGLGKAGSPTGSGVIAHVDVTMKAPFVGTTPLVLADCKLADEQGHPIPVSACTGATLQTNPTPTATATLTPTTTPITPQDIGGISRDSAVGGHASSDRRAGGGSPPIGAAVLVTMAGLAVLAGVAALVVNRRARD